ncbi:hypothetical protein [Streptomyces bluensis]|uniref:hypothetical protein n=1 Tax=Streptomyces bluensis TaxID=33897 RepID=UPI003322841D
MSGDGDTHNSVSGGRQQGGVTQAHTVNNLWVDLSRAVPPIPGTWLLVLDVLGLVLAALYWPGGPLSQYVAFGLLCTGALVTAGCSVVTGRPDRGRGAPKPEDSELSDAAQRQAGETKDNRRRRVARVTFPVVSLLFSVAGLLAFQNVVDTGEVPTEIHIRGTQPLNGPRPAPLTLDVPAPEEPRGKLRLSLTTLDDDQSTGSCVHKTTATVTAITPGVTPNAYEVAAEDTVDFDLGGNTKALRFTFTLHTEADCSMRLAKATGTLHG